MYIQYSTGTGTVLAFGVWERGGGWVRVLICSVWCESRIICTDEVQISKPCECRFSQSGLGDRSEVIYASGSVS